MDTRTLFVAVALASCTLLTSPPAHAADEPFGNHLYDKYQLGGSLAGVFVGSNVRIDASDGSAGTELNFEDDLGFQPSIAEPRLFGRWRPGHRHELEASYLFARRTSDKRIAKDINFADTSFTAGLRIKSAFNSDLANLTYRYAIHASETSQIGAAIGFGAYFYKIELDAVASATSGGGGDSVEYTSSKSFIAPTATLGAYGRFRVGSRWYIAPDLRVLYLAIERVHARVFDAAVSGQYFFKPRFAGQIGYAGNVIRLDVDPKDPGGGTGVINLDVGAKIKFSTQSLYAGILYTF